MLSALYWTNMQSWIFIVLAHWNKSPRVDIFLHFDILSWFWANQSLLILLNAVCVSEKQQIPIFTVFGLTRLRLKHTMYPTPDEHANIYTMIWPDWGSNTQCTSLQTSMLTFIPWLDQTEAQTHNVPHSRRAC